MRNHFFDRCEIVRKRLDSCFLAKKNGIRLASREEVLKGFDRRERVGMFPLSTTRVIR